MKIHLTLLFIIFCTLCFPVSAINPIVEASLSFKSKQEQEAVHQVAQWNDDLYLYLFNNQDADISLIGYLAYFSELSNFLSVFELTKKYTPEYIINDINHMIKTNQLSPYGLNLVLVLCSKYQVLSDDIQCETKLIFQKQVENSTGNAIIYVYPIKRAVNEKNNVKLAELLKQMSLSQYFELYNYTPKNLGKIIDEFVVNHPFGESLIAMQKKYLHKDLEGYTEEEKLELSEYFEESLLTAIKINFELAVLDEMQPLRPISDICKNEIKYQNECLDITNLLIQSNDIVPTMVGHVIKTEILNKNSDKQSYEYAELAYHKYKAHYECIMKINESVGGVSMFAPHTFNLLSTIQREKGDLAFYLKITQLYYQEQLQKGNTTIQNPDDC